MNFQHITSITRRSKSKRTLLLIERKRADLHAATTLKVCHGSPTTPSSAINCDPVLEQFSVTSFSNLFITTRSKARKQQKL